MRAIFWRIWAVGTVGWVIIIGINLGSTYLVYEELSTEAVRLQARIDKSPKGSYDRWKAGVDLRAATRNRFQARNEMFFDAGYLSFPPLAVLLIAYLVSLLLTDDEEGDEEGTAASA